MPTRVVTLSHATGAGGDTIGRTVAERLGFRYIDEELIALAAQKEGVDAAVVADAERRRSFLDRLFAGETIYALGRGEWLVGVTAICEYPAAARALPKVGGLAAPNLEQIVRLRPDVVFATAQGNARDLLEQLERLGLTTFALRPDSYGGVLESMRAVGRAVAADPAARRIVDEVGGNVRTVQALVGGHSRPRVLYLIWTDPLIAAGAGTYLDDLLELAGGRNIVRQRTGSYPRLNWEQVVNRAPEVILLADHREDSDRAATGGSDPPPHDGRALPDLQPQQAEHRPRPQSRRRGQRSCGSRSGSTCSCTTTGRRRWRGWASITPPSVP